MKILVYILAGTFLAHTPILAIDVDALSELSKFSCIKKVSLNKIKDGKIQGEKITLPNSELGIGTETLFVVPASPEQVLDHIANFDASNKTEAGDAFDLEEHHQISIPALKSDFEAFKLDSSHKPSKWLMSESGRVSKKSALNLSKNELQKLRLTVEGLKEQHGKRWMVDGAVVLAQAWQEIFMERALQYQKGSLTMASAYHKGAHDFDIPKEVAIMLAGSPQVRVQFEGLLQKAFDGGGEFSYYWEQAKVNGHQTVNLGAFTQERGEGSYKALELQYYVTSTYYNSMTLYQMWPLEDGTTLVWRGDYVISAALRFLKGMQRMAARNIMLLEVKKSVKSFVSDFE